MGTLDDDPLGIIQWKMATPLAAMFLTDKIHLAIFIEGHQMTISTKLFQFRPPFSEEKIFKVFVIAISLTFWQPFFFLTYQISFS